MKWIPIKAAATYSLDLRERIALSLAEIYWQIIFSIPEAGQDQRLTSSH